jgi:hypothetical protein
MAPSDINNRIRRVTKDLQALHEELQKLSVSPSDRGKHEQLLDKLLTLNVIQDFKAAIDHMRHFLWAYIESASRVPGDDRDLKMHTLRMERATEMLRILRQRLDGPGMRRVPGATSFFEEIQRIADAAMTRHAKSSG